MVLPDENTRAPGEGYDIGEARDDAPTKVYCPTNGLGAAGPIDGGTWKY